MNLSLEKLAIYDFNRRELADADFYEICEKEQITVLERNVSTSFYLSVGGKSFIVLSKKLKGLRKTFAAFHELAHHFLHGARGREFAFFFGLLDTKNETEADAMALIALIPKSKIGDYAFLETHPNRFARKIFKDRQRLYFLYGI